MIHVKMMYKINCHLYIIQKSKITIMQKKVHKSLSSNTITIQFYQVFMFAN